MNITERPIGIQLERAPLPFHLSNRGVASEVAVHPENILISDLEKQKYEKILELLDHPELHEAIENGIFTLGIVKANAHEGINLPEDDEKATQELLREVRDRGFNVVFEASLQLTREEAERFYDEHRDKPFFDSLIDFTTSGPKTYILLQDRSGKAVSKWRHEIGSTKAAPDEMVPGHPERKTLRSLFRNPDKKSNNVFHGSDSRGSALREIKALRDYIKDVCDRLDGEKPEFPTQDDLAIGGVLTPGVDQLISVEKSPVEIPDEPTNYVIRYRDPQGQTLKRIYQK